MADIYVVKCPRCENSFRTRKALATHFSKKHPGYEVPENITFSFGKKEAPTVIPRLLKNRKHYLQWLAEIVECINSAHNPSVPARWCHFTHTSVKVEFFGHLLKKIGSARLNAVKECRHLKPPLWREKALRMSFKTFEMSDLKRALSEQESVDLHVTKSFSGSKEIDGAPSQLSGRAALEAAKRKRVHQQASLRSEIICGDGEGRATRECELIWSPIFDSPDNGILTLRVYVGKVHL